jgi:hypothetical protein
LKILQSKKKANKKNENEIYQEKNTWKVESKKNTSLKIILDYKNGDQIWQNKKFNEDEI